MLLVRLIAYMTELSRMKHTVGEKNETIAWLASVYIRFLFSGKIKVIHT